MLVGCFYVGNIHVLLLLTQDCSRRFDLSTNKNDATKHSAGKVNDNVVQLFIKRKNIFGLTEYITLRSFGLGDGTATFYFNVSISTKVAVMHIQKHVLLDVIPKSREYEFLAPTFWR